MLCRLTHRYLIIKLKKTIQHNNWTSHVGTCYYTKPLFVQCIGSPCWQQKPSQAVHSLQGALCGRRGDCVAPRRVHWWGELHWSSLLIPSLWLQWEGGSGSVAQVEAPTGDRQGGRLGGWSFDVRARWSIDRNKNKITTIKMLSLKQQTIDNFRDFKSSKCVFKHAYTASNSQFTPKLKRLGCSVLVNTVLRRPIQIVHEATVHYGDPTKSSISHSTFSDEVSTANSLPILRWHRTPHNPIYLLANKRPSEFRDNLFTVEIRRPSARQWGATCLEVFKLSARYRTRHNTCRTQN